MLSLNLGIMGQKSRGIPNKADLLALYKINGGVVEDTIGESTGPVQPGRGYTGDGTAYITIAGLLTTDTITADSDDVPICTTDGQLDITSGDVVYGVTITRSDAQIAYFACAEGSGTVCINSFTGDGALSSGVISDDSIHTELVDGTGFDLNQLGFNYGQIAINKVASSDNLILGGWYMTSAITYTPLTGLLEKNATTSGRIMYSTVYGATKCRVTVRAKKGVFSTMQIGLIDKVTSANLGSVICDLKDDYDYYSIFTMNADPINGIAIVIYPGSPYIGNGSIYIGHVSAHSFDTYDESKFLAEIVTTGSEKSQLITKNLTSHFTNCVVVGDSLTGNLFVENCNKYSTYMILTKKSVGGTTLATIAATFHENVVDFGATSVLIQGATNTLTAAISYPIDTMWTLYKSMIDDATANSILPVLATMGPFYGAETWTQERQDWCIEWNQKIRDYALANGYKVLDLYELWVDTDGISFRSELLLEDNFVHPNDAGKEIESNAFLAIADSLTNFDARFGSGILCSGATGSLDHLGNTLQYRGRLKYNLLTSEDTFAFPLCLELSTIDQAAGGDFFYDSEDDNAPIYRTAAEWLALDFVNKRDDGRVGMSTTLVDDFPKKSYVYSVVQDAVLFAKEQRYIGND